MNPAPELRRTLACSIFALLLVAPWPGIRPALAHDESSELAEEAEIEKLDPLTQHLVRAEWFRDDREFDKALGHLALARRMAPSDPRVARLGAKFEFDAGHHVAAESLANRVLASLVDDATALGVRARVRAARGEARALIDYDRWVTSEPSQREDRALERTRFAAQLQGPAPALAWLDSSAVAH
ncbi:MAG: hypothetical protein HOP12_07940, partial [Candidatus Eisenbacteria bacterium]|nr:hypothetical protein [Candidatus Eisenbacteria bacterium]